MENIDEFDRQQKYPNEIVYAEQRRVSALAKDIITLAICQLHNEVTNNPNLLDNLAVEITLNRSLINQLDANAIRFKEALSDLLEFTLILSNNGTTYENLDLHITKPFFDIIYKDKKLKILVSSRIARGFVDLKSNYTNIYIKDSLNLTSFKSKRLYEILVCVKNFTLDSRRAFSDEDLKRKLQVKANYDVRHKQFEKEIIQTSVEEINIKTNIFITYDRIKARKGEYHTLFTVISKNEEKEEKQLLLEPPTAAELGVSKDRYQGWIEGMQGWNIPREHMITIFRDKNLLNSYHRWRHAYYCKSDKEKEKIKSPGAVVLTHLGIIVTKNSKKYLETKVESETKQEAPHKQSKDVPQSKSTTKIQVKETQAEKEERLAGIRQIRENLRKGISISDTKAETEVVEVDITKITTAFTLDKFGSNRK